MRNRRPNGFTLIEVLGAMAILAGAIIGIILCGANGMAAATDIERAVRCSLLAQTEIESIKGIVADDPDIPNWSWVTTNLGDGYLVRTDLTGGSGSSPIRVILVSVGYDTDGDAILDSDESRAELLTMICEEIWDSVL